jgi:hypothetical protein
MDNFSSEIMDVVIDGLANHLPSKEILLDTVIDLEDRYSKLQSRRSLIRKLINDSTQELSYIKQLNNQFYEDATPETPKGRFSFHCYKNSRATIKGYKRQINTLVEIQLDIKVQMKQVSALIGMINRKLAKLGV